LSLEFLLTSLIVVIAPGTGVLFTLAAGLAGGSRTALVAAAGCTLGIVPHIVAAVTGLAALLHVSALAFQIFKIAGVVWLLYMAWAVLEERGPLEIDERRAPRSTGRTILAAILVNLLNPKLSIFFLAFLPQFVDPRATAPVLRMLELSAVFMGLTFVVFVGYGVAAATIRRQVIERPSVLAWLRRSFAAAFVALGARLALAER